jgi:hypothetical protein
VTRTPAPWLPFEASEAHVLTPTGPGRARLVLRDGGPELRDVVPAGWTARHKGIGRVAPVVYSEGVAITVPGTRPGDLGRFRAEERNWRGYDLSHDGGDPGKDCNAGSQGV